MSADDSFFSDAKLRNVGQFTFKGTITYKDGMYRINGGTLLSLLDLALPTDINGKARLHLEIAVEDQPSAA